MTTTITSMLLALMVTACTSQERARDFGGELSIELDSGHELVNATWKEYDLWVLTRRATPGHAPQTYYFQEISSFGVLQGTVIIKETK